MMKKVVGSGRCRSIDQGGWDVQYDKYTYNVCNICKTYAGDETSVVSGTHSHFLG